MVKKKSRSRGQELGMGKGILCFLVIEASAPEGKKKTTTQRGREKEGRKRGKRREGRSQGERKGERQP